MNGAVGCRSADPIATRTIAFRERYEGKEFAWAGRIRSVTSTSLDIDMGAGRSELVLALMPGQENHGIRPGQTIRARFTLTQLGTCTVPFRGQDAVILTIDGERLR